jgi:hypothetical protein
MKRSADDQWPGMATAKSIQRDVEYKTEPHNDHAIDEPPADAFATVQTQPMKGGETPAQRQEAPSPPVGTTADPVMEARMWLSRAAESTTFEERLVNLSQAVSVAPGQPSTRQRMYETLKPYLARRPFLRYSHENALLYRVSTAEGMALNVAKDRAIVTPYPPPLKSSPLRPVFRWFRWSLLGLLVAGLGTLICAPMAARAAWLVSHHASNPLHRKRASVIFVYALVLWLIALLLSGLFVIHLYAYR